MEQVRLSEIAMRILYYRHCERDALPTELYPRRRSENYHLQRIFNQAFLIAPHSRLRSQRAEAALFCSEVSPRRFSQVALTNSGSVTFLPSISATSSSVS